MKAKKKLAGDDNFPHLATTKAGVAHIEDRPPLIYHFDTAATKGHKIHAHSAFANYQGSLLPERRVLAERYTLTDRLQGRRRRQRRHILRDRTFHDGGRRAIVSAGQAGAGIGSRKDRRAPARHVPSRMPRGRGSARDAGRERYFFGRYRRPKNQPALDPKTNRHFYVRQLKNRHLGSIGEVIEGKALEAYANLCGRTLARAHARSGDPALLAGYMGKSEVLDDALASFAMAYAALTKHDHAQLKAAIDTRTGLARK
ncbi:MAG: DUF2252 family protein [Methylocella sp.]